MNSWQGNRVRLCAIEPEDATAFHAWNQEAERSRLLDFMWPPSSLASVRAWTESQALKCLEHDAYHWVIRSLATDDPVGSISTHNCNHRCGTFSYGVDISAPCRRRGYASDAIRLVVRYYFEELRYQKVTVSIHEDNEASLELHRRLGFREEGRLRRMVYTNGHYLDEIWLGMTCDEFAAR